MDRDFSVSTSLAMDDAEVVKVGDHGVDVVALRGALLAWGAEHFRPFPWRQVDDPYRILIAEVMLHRTQAVQVVPVYQSFIRRFPDVDALATASLQDLHDLLRPLGLRWRIDLIHTMAGELGREFGGAVPQTREALLSLTGVSDYIACAVRCFAWDLPGPLVDTNTVRVAGRVFGLRVRDSSRRNRRFRAVVGALEDRHRPRRYSYALLDLADAVCTKKRTPECERCPLAAFCASWPWVGDVDEAGLSSDPPHQTGTLSDRASRRLY